MYVKKSIIFTKKSKLILLIMFILSWSTIPLLGRNSLKRYLPSALMMVCLTKFLDVFGERRKWWRFYKGIPPLDSMDFLNFGPYFVSSLWMLKLTYGKFLTFLVSNSILHILFIFLGLKYIKQFRILSLVNLTKFQYLFIDFLRANILYGFQFAKEKVQSFLYKGINKNMI